MSTMSSAQRGDGKRTFTQVEEEPEVPKKLRLRIREPSAAGCVQDAAKESASESASLGSLGELRSEWLPGLAADAIPALLRALAGLLTSKAGSTQLLETTCELMKELLARGVGELPASEIRAIGASFAASLDTGPNVQLLELLNLLAASRAPGWEGWAEDVMPIARDSVRAESWALRREALGTLSLWSSLGVSAVGRADVVSLLSARAGDADPRVRVEAVRGLEALSAAAALPLHAYAGLGALLGDEEEEVRLSALPLLAHFAAAYPNERLADRGGRAGLRLVDDAFCQLCHAMNDAALGVRVAAATLLGTVDGVGASFLHQTLDKKLLSANKAARQQRYGRAAAAASEWSTGRRLGGDAPAEKAEEDSDSLIPTGACGAFVTGLEDEFLGVRQACVRSLSRLASSVPALASKALDFLADMFNDEIAEVRLGAIASLGPLITHGCLSEDQMEIILNVLDDVSGASRAALRELLTAARLPTVTALHMALTALLANLRKYPGDQDDVWRALSALGRNHPSLVLPLAPKLLGLHAFFDIAEPPIDNPAYVAKLLLVLNAARGNGPLLALFPAHLWRQQLYLRHAYPELVPALRAERAAADAADGSAGDETRDGLYRRLLAAQKLGGRPSAAMLRLLSGELEALLAAEEGGGGGAALLLCLCRLRLGLGTFLQTGWTRQSEAAVHAWTELWALLTELDGVYAGGGVALSSCVADVRLRLALAALALCHKSSAHNFPLPRLWEALEAYRSAPGHCPAFLGSATSALAALAERKAGSRLALGDAFRAGVLELLEAEPLRLPPGLHLGAVERLSGRLRRDSDGALRVTAGLGVAVQLSAELQGLEAVGGRDRIRIQAEYPDERRSSEAPRAVDWDGGRLSTRVVLSASLWTHKAPVTLSLVLLGRPGDVELLRALDRKELGTRGLSLALHRPEDAPTLLLHPRPR